MTKLVAFCIRGIQKCGFHGLSFLLLTVNYFSDVDDARIVYHDTLRSCSLAAQ